MAKHIHTKRCNHPRSPSLPLLLQTILVIGHKNKELDFKQELIANGILAAHGTGFGNLSKNYVRVSLPAKAEDFLDHLTWGINFEYAQRACVSV